jgi:hypothetical protein
MERSRLLFLAALACALLFVRTSKAAEATSPTSLSPEQRQHLAALIAKLDSEEFEEREQAERALQDSDSNTLPFVRHILEEPLSPECAERLKRAIIAIRWHEGMPAASVKRWSERLRSRAPGQTAQYLEHYNANGTRYSAAELTELLREHVFAPEFELSNSSITCDQNDILISQTEENHELICDLLELMRAAAKAPPDQNSDGVVVSKLESWRPALSSQLETDRVSIDFNAVPLTDAIKRLQPFSRTPLTLDPSLDPAELAEVTLKLDDVSVNSALLWISRVTETKPILYDHASVLIQDRENRNLECCVYDVADVDSAQGLGVKTWIEEHCVYRWDSGAYMEQHGNSLIVRHDHDSQVRIWRGLAQLRQFMKQIRAVEIEGKAPAMPLDPAKVPVQTIQWPEADSDTKWKQGLHKKLERKISFEFLDVPLPDALDFIRSQCQINLVIDPALAADGSTRTPITLRVTEMSADLALDWILRLANRAVVYRDEAIFVTTPLPLDTPTEPSEQLLLRMYYVRDLAGVVSPEDLETLVKSSVRPDRWDQALGTSLDEKQGVLLAVQTAEVHAIIESVLKELRLHCNDRIFNATAAAHAVDRRDDAVRSKLANQVTVSFENTPISDAFATLLAGIPFTLDPDMGSPNVTLSGEKLEIGKALTALNLGYAVDDGRLYIGPESFINTQRNQFVVYNLADLNDEQRTETSNFIGDLVQQGMQIDAHLAGDRLIVVQTVASLIPLQQKLEELRKGQAHK